MFKTKSKPRHTGEFAKLVTAHEAHPEVQDKLKVSKVCLFFFSKKSIVTVVKQVVEKYAFKHNAAVLDSVLWMSAFICPPFLFVCFLFFLLLLLLFTFVLRDTEKGMEGGN